MLCIAQLPTCIAQAHYSRVQDTHRCSSTPPFTHLWGHVLTLVPSSPLSLRVAVGFVWPLLQVLVVSILVGVYHEVLVVSHDRGMCLKTSKEPPLLAVMVVDMRYC